MKTHLLYILFACCALHVNAQQAKLLAQRSLAKWEVGTANFSGIAPLGGGRYAVVSDKEPADGFFVMRIDQDSATGAVQQVEVEGFYGVEPAQRDAYGNSTRDTEGVAFHPGAQTVWISGEGDQSIVEYQLSGQPTGRTLAVPSQFAVGNIYPNCGFEALCYDASRQCFWATTETTLPADGQRPGWKAPRAANLLRLQSFGDDLQPAGQWAYRTDEGTVSRFGRGYISGVPALTALPDGRLLLMEREGHFARRGIGSFVRVKIFAVRPEAIDAISPAESLTSLPAERFLPKTLVAEWVTRLNLTRRDLANYEGFCPGAVLADGRQTLLCVNDSQAGMGNGLFRLRDYLKVIVLPPLIGR
ncbi:MAG: esterase-like activity of phytase family protein [Bacteroidaceae bacterium]|nr:esterase-like activity of phytase family protein [Bacteroidaceae bacterium]